MFILLILEPFKTICSEMGTETIDGLISWFESMPAKLHLHYKNHVFHHEVSHGYYYQFESSSIYKMGKTGTTCQGISQSMTLDPSPRHFQPIVYLSNSQQGRVPPARESLLALREWEAWTG